MAKLYIAKQGGPKDFVSWALYHVGGQWPMRREVEGFSTVSEARQWAKKWHHEIVTLTAKGAQ